MSSTAFQRAAASGQRCCGRTTTPTLTLIPVTLGARCGSVRRVPARRETALVVAATAGPVLFTATWLVVGLVQARYSAHRSTISALAAVGAPHAAWVVAAFVVQGLGQLACARLAWHRDGARWVAAWLAISAAGTIAAGLLPL